LQSSSPTHDKVLHFYMVGLWDYVFMYVAYIFTFIIYSDLLLWFSYMFQLSTKQKDLSTTSENNKFMVWMENNKDIIEVEDNDNPDCCAKCNFVWNPISLTWEANIEI